MMHIAAQVFLRVPQDAQAASAGRALVYAASWWQADQVRASSVV